QRGPVYQRLLESARVLEGLARHASTHAAGVLITPGPLLDYVPLYRQKDDSVTTQWDMKAVEKAGLLKMDFLGLRTLSVLEEAVRLVERKTGERLELSRLPMDDAAAYRVFQDAETVAIFQFESSGMRDYLRRLKPTIGSLFTNRRRFTVHALDAGMKLVSRRVSGVVWNGRKPVFELRTAQGKNVTATANHPFLTLDGWKKLSDLVPGERIAGARRLAVASRTSWPRHELVALAGLLAEGNTCHPTSLYFYGNDRVLIQDFA